MSAIERRGKKAPPFLAPETRAVERKPFLTYDIESKADDTQRAGFTRPFLVGAYDPEGREYVAFRDLPHLREPLSNGKIRSWQDRHYNPGGCVDRFLRWVLDDRFAGRNIYAHNGGNFDHMFLVRWLRLHDDEFCFRILPVQSSIQALVVWRREDEVEDVADGKKRKGRKSRKKQWTFLDSLKLFPVGLDKLCQTFSVKGKVEHDLHLHEDDAAWEVYLKQDCIALAEVLWKIHDLVENKLGGEVGMTAPSTALKVFRRRFLGKGKSPKRVARYQHFDECKDKGGIDHETGEVCRGCCHKWIRKGYYGGRTELFEDYGEHVRYYDFNSSYAASMAEPVPCGKRFIEEGGIDWRLFKSGKERGGWGGFAEVSVYIPPTCKIPPLPHRNKVTNKLTFPVGYFSGVWSLEELALLQDPFVGGEILRVGRVVWFERVPLFTEMVESLWTLRDKTLPGFDEGLSALGKLIYNSTYGKFGMREERQQIVFSNPEMPGQCHLCGQPCRSEDNSLCDRCVGSTSATGDPDSDVWYQKSVVDAPYVIPQVSAHITATARVRLWRAMRDATLMGGRVLYCDTDSVITDVVLPSSPALGELKDEYPGRTMTFVGVGAKCYAISLDPKEGVVDKEPVKVTMKGFGKELRTMDNLVALRRSAKVAKGSPCDLGEHSWERLARPRGKSSVQAPDGECAACSAPYRSKSERTCYACGWRDGELALRCRECGTLEFDRLSKVRSLASAGFERPPWSRKTVKSFRSGYDKRVLWPDGTTTPCFVDERGRHDFGVELSLEEASAAAEE